MNSKFEDARWDAVFTRAWRCTGCATSHRGLFDLASLRPEAWNGSEQYVPNSAALSETNFLSEDFCVLDGKHFFVRCVLLIPLVGAAGESFGFGVWLPSKECARFWGGMVTPC
jgi:hypothetical protein